MPHLTARTLASVLLGALVLISAEGLVGAQEPTAKDHYRRGTSYYRDGRFSEAAREYAMAFDKAGAPELAYNTARAFDKAGRWDDARVYYERWLAGPPPMAEREKLAKKLHEGGLEAHDAGDDGLAVTRMAYALRVQVSPNPQIPFDLAEFHEEAGNNNLAREMYRRALADGYGDTSELNAALERLERGGRGRVVLLGEVRQVQVRVDGRLLVGVDTGKEFELPAGPHEISLEKTGHRSWHGQVEVRSGQIATVPFVLRRQGGAAAPPRKPPPALDRPTAPPPRPGGPVKPSGFSAAPPALAWVSFGVGAVGLGAGLLFGSLASKAEEDLKECRDDLKCAVQEELAPTQEYSDRAQKNQSLANLSFGLSIAAIAGGVLVWYLHEPAAREADLDDDEDFVLIPSRRGFVAGAAWRF